MFVLKNAWAALGRVKWRTALIALLTLLVSFSAAVNLSVLKADDTANNETYQSQKASAVISPSRLRRCCSPRRAWRSATPT